MFALSTALLASGLCQNWDGGKQIGSLDHLLAPEASGIAVSKDHSNRLYHVNDSGSDGHLVVTDSSGESPIRVTLRGFEPEDVEDLSLGSCGLEGGDCIFVGDIGDNDETRSEIQIALVREKARFAEEETPARTLRVRYPDGAHNAEGLAVHPNGDIFIVIKGANTTLYKLPASAWNSDSRERLTLDRVGDLNLGPSSLTDEGEEDEGQLVTSLDISPDGMKFIVLTYKDAFEFHLDLSSGDDVSVARPRPIELTPLKKQESISYLPDGRSFIYSTESKKKDGPLMQVSCTQAMRPLTGLE